MKYFSKGWLGIGFRSPDTSNDEIIRLGVIMVTIMKINLDIYHSWNLSNSSYGLYSEQDDSLLSVSSE